MQDVDVVALILLALPSRNLTILWLELGALWTLLIAFFLLIAFLIVLLLLEVGSAVVSFMVLTKPATAKYFEIQLDAIDEYSFESSSSTSSASFPSSAATTTEIALTLPAESHDLPLIIDTTSHLSLTFAAIVEHNIRAGLVFHSSILLNALVLSLDETSLDSSLDSDGTPSPAFSDFSYFFESDSESGSDSEPESDASSIGDDYDLPYSSAPIVELSTTTPVVLPPSLPSLSLSESTLNPSAPTFAPSPSPRIAISNLSATAASFAPAPTHPIDALLTPLLTEGIISFSINELNLQAEMAAAELTKLEGDRFVREENAKWERSPEGLARAREWRKELRMQITVYWC
ncbi:hypothetical protein RQP46_004285 [Phenoliferia psychrophenolica]